MNTTDLVRPGISLTLVVLMLAAAGMESLFGAPPPAMDPPRVTINAPAVTIPPESFFQMIEQRLRQPRRRGRGAGQEGSVTQTNEAAIASEMALYRGFYRKYIDVRGMPAAAHADVSDLALRRTYDIVTHMLAGRPDILQAMVSNRTYLIVIGKNQVYTDMPEYRNHPDPVFQNERVRGTGGNPTSFGEENLLSLPVDRYDDESIAVHEFCHTIDSTLNRIDPAWEQNRRAAWENVRARGLYHEAYAGTNPGEYWAEIAQAYFDCNRVNNWNHGPVGHREQLHAYDPLGYELCRSVFRLRPGQDWRYNWLQPLPMVSGPPDTARFKDIDPWYTKFTLAREFTVVGHGASDESLLRANYLIRHLFAYRHDILKALMADNLKLVVLGPNESVGDLPEYRKLADPATVDHTLRCQTVHPGMKLLVVGQENVLQHPGHPDAGGSQVVRVFADAMYRVAGMRPAIPDFRGTQQYELRVKRLDEQFDRAVSALYAQAEAAGKWKGTAAVADKVAFWVAGVMAYFDAAGQEAAPLDALSPITTREKLREYDPGLYALVHETMGYAGKVDWRANQ